jgi:TIR domain
MRRILVSYRRADSEYAAGALGRELRRFFGDEHVFRDKEDITGGVSWKQHVLQAIEGDSALLVLIGKNWTHITDSHGRRRLDDSADPVRLELADAIRERAAVIPILLEGAEMPREAELPEEIRPMAEYNALRLRDGDWSHDISKILGTLEKVGFTARQAAAGDSPRTAGQVTPATRRPFGKLVTSYILSLFFGVAAATDETINSSALGGFGLFCLGSLALAAFAYRDYPKGKSSSKWPATVAVALASVAAIVCFGRATVAPPPPPVRPQLTGGVWTLGVAMDKAGNDWSNSVLQFTSQETTEDGLRLRGTFTWRAGRVVIGTEDVTGQYEDKTRKIILVSDAVREIPHAGVERLILGSYSAVLASGDRRLVDGRWGASPPDGILGHWEAVGKW